MSMWQKKGKKLLLLGLGLVLAVSLVGCGQDNTNTGTDCQDSQEMCIRDRCLYCAAAPFQSDT